jgi:aromatic-L-amino-acid/L-tryptophan decarboxylase
MIDPADPACLELSASDMRSMLDAAAARVLDHLARVGEQPATGDTSCEAFCRSMREPAPEEPAPLEPLLDRFFDEWMPRSLTTNGPGYLGYVPGGGIFTAAIADLLSNTTNRFTGARFAAPALVELESNVLGWLRDWMLFPETTRGVFTTGGSMANFNAVLCARERLLGADIRRGVLYASTQVHHSVTKAARLAGIMADRVRAVPVDDAFRLRVDSLTAAITADRAAGLTPFLVVSSAGTTNTGAVDPLDAVADVCAREGLWHHIDGAYGAFFHTCSELRPLLAGLSRADSLTLDPHKGLFLPYGTGALLVRDGTALKAVHTSSADYFPDRTGEELYDPSEYGPDLSRGFPGLRVWLTVKTFGTARIRAAIAEKRALALDASERIAALPGVVMTARPQLSLFAFHLAWKGSTRDQENAATRELLDRVAARGRVFLTGCTTGGRFLARVCVLSFRTRQDRIDACVEDIAAEARQILERAAR